MRYNVFYRRGKDHVFGNFNNSGIEVQIHVLYNSADGETHTPGVTTVEFYPAQHPYRPIYRNRPNSVTANGTDNATVKEAINKFFKAVVVDEFVVADSYDD